MKIEQIIIDALGISKESKVPLLLMSNPGYGKTTILQKYAKQFSYHLETLIGSRFSPEDISGYQVNNRGDHLQHISPEWFCRVWDYHNKGTPSILFLDEISCSSEAVQGPLLSLVFDRTIGSEKYLPDDCLVISAANYSGNLSSFMNLLSPTLNRFLILNLLDNYTCLDLLDEFLETEPKDSNSITYPNKASPMTAEMERAFTEKYKEFWRNTFIKYGDPESAIGLLDISNTNFSDLYSSAEKNIYNFISGRSLSYLQRVLKAYMEMDLNNPQLLYKLCDGLVGNGTCSFKEEAQGEKYRKYLHKGIEKLISKKRTSKAKPTLCGDIAKDVSSFLVAKENLATTPEDDLFYVKEIVTEIKTQFDVEKVISNSEDSEYISKFVTDFESCIELFGLISMYPDSNNLTNELAKVTMDFYGLYCDILGIEPNFKETFGITNTLFERMCLLEHKMPDGSIKYERGALRKLDRFSIPSLYVVGKDESLLNAGLSKIMNMDSKIKVLTYKGNFCFEPMEKYLKNYKKTA
ncbi:MAG: AAA family ATPase [Treponema sp.]|nr:AAA family ATPase [Treponema sp.]